MRSLRARAIAAALALALALPAAAFADLVQLKDGRWIEGVPIQVDGETVVVKYKNGDVRLPMALVEDYVIEGAPPAEPKTDEERAKREQGLVPFRGKWVKAEVRAKAIKDETAKRKAALEDMRAHEEWRNRYKFETKNFKFESTLPPHINEEYAALLEAYFEDYRKQWGIKVPKEWGKLPVCFYRNRSEFAQVSGGRGGVVAYYRFVAPRELDFYYDRNDPQQTQDALFHEANHYLADLIDEEFQYPHWIGEAIAEYYGAAEWDPKARTIKVGRVQEGRLAEIRADMDAGKMRSIYDVVGDEGQDYEHYNWGWSFVHFMLSTPAYEKKFRQYFIDLAKAKDVTRIPFQGTFTTVSGDEARRVFMKRLGITALEGLEKEWHAYIANLQPTGTRGFEMSGIDAYRQGRIKFRAPRQLKAAIDAGSRRPVVHIYYARCLRYKGDPESLAAAVAVIENALKVCDPLNGSLWAEYGYLLYAQDRKEEGKKLVALARELEPEGSFLDIEIAEAITSSDE